MKTTPTAVLSFSGGNRFVLTTFRLFRPQLSERFFGLTHTVSPQNDKGFYLTAKSSVLMVSAREILRCAQNDSEEASSGLSEGSFVRLRRTQDDTIACGGLRMTPSSTEKTPIPQTS